MGAKKILILGAGFGGLETATGLSEGLGEGYEITLVDKSPSFFIGFSKIDVLFGRRSEEEVRYRYADLRPAGVRFVQDEITAIDLDARQVTTRGDRFDYDTLVIALGADLDPEATPGFRESGGHEFYSMPGALRLKPVVEAFSKGTLVLGILGLPYKCPPAPYEVACQLHALFQRRGVREAITMKMVVPGARPVPNPKVSDVLEGLLAERGIELVAGAPIQELDAGGQEVVTASGRIPYDLFLGVPVHVPPAVVRATRLGAQGFVQPNRANLETSVPGVYAIGDVSKIPVGEGKAVPKAGAFAEDAARSVVADILAKEGRAPAPLPFLARGACYLELGDGQVAKLNADFFGGEQPSMNVEGPSPEMHPDKLAFETTRRDRWFKR